jgi:hypothetical protein
LKPLGFNSRARLRAVGLFLGVIASTTALGQASTSVLTGNVVDSSSKAPVPDVVVTATSPSLQGEQVVVTDSTGLYRVPQLPPGVYTLRFEKESYRPYSRAGIDVAADRTLRLNVELLPETAGTETVTVIGTPPTIDVGSSATGTTINQDFVRSVAVARPGGIGGANRSFDSLATTAPQANADYYGVGINGATSPENLYLIDGISVNNPGFGTLGTPLTAEFMDEVNVVTGGYMPEYGRTSGGAISAITKCGGNDFHGSGWGTFTPGSLTGPAGVVPGATPVVQGKRDLGNFGDIGGTLGGYIIKDRLWFFAGIQWAAQRYIYSRSFNRQINGQFEPIPDSTQRRNGDERSFNYIGKLTYLINSDHRVSVTVTGTPTTGGGDGSLALRNRSNNRAPFNSNTLTLGTFNSGYTRAKFDAIDVGGELSSSFMDAAAADQGWMASPERPYPPAADDIDNGTCWPACHRSVLGRPHPGLQRWTQTCRARANRLHRGGRVQRRALLHRRPRWTHRDAEVRQLPGARRADLSAECSRPPRHQGRLRRSDQPVRA